jgi:hypothetical protein
MISASRLDIIKINNNFDRDVRTIITKKEKMKLHIGCILYRT